MALKTASMIVQNSLDSREVREDPGGIERRRDARYPTNDPAEIHILPLNGPSLPATVIDVSRSGLRLELSTQLARGLGVEVVMPGDAVVFGEVRYCRRARDAFRVGIRIEDVVYSRLDQGEHIPENQLLLYLNGSGLKVPEVVRARDHLQHCQKCRVRFKHLSSAARDKPA
jgi:hypothetical protein